MGEYLVVYGEAAGILTQPEKQKKVTLEHREVELHNLCLLRSVVKLALAVVIVSTFCSSFNPIKSNISLPYY